MKRSIIPMIVAILSILIHLSLMLITASSIIVELKSIDWVFLVLLAIALVVEITALVASICLIYGINKEHKDFITPWLFVIGLYMILNIADFIGGYNALGFLFPIKVVVAALHIAFWFFIYKYLQYVRSK